MRYSGTLFAVKDMACAREFYENLLECIPEMDLGVYVSYTNGLCLQDEKIWLGFIEKRDDQLIYGANDAEIYFEAEDLDMFLERLESFHVKLVHPLKEHSWGQRAIRFYDPDQHIIEVGEGLDQVARRFMKSGMSLEEAAKRIEVSTEYLSARMNQSID